MRGGRGRGESPAPLPLAGRGGCEAGNSTQSHSALSGASDPLTEKTAADKGRQTALGRSRRRDQVHARFSGEGLQSEAGGGLVKEESSMALNLVPRGALAALAGAALVVAASSAPGLGVHFVRAFARGAGRNRRRPARLVGPLGPLASQSSLGLAALGLGRRAPTPTAFTDPSAIAGAARGAACTAAGGDRVPRGGVPAGRRPPGLSLPSWRRARRRPRSWR